MLHLKKLCVGIKSFEMLQEWQDNELKCNRQLFHTTRMKPKKINEILPNGSIYWIAKNKFFARQKNISSRPGRPGPDRTGSDRAGPDQTEARLDWRPPNMYESCRAILGISWLLKSYGKDRSTIC